MALGWPPTESRAGISPARSSGGDAHPERSYGVEIYHRTQRGSLTYVKCRNFEVTYNSLSK